MKKLIWLPVCLVVSITWTSFLVNQGCNITTLFLTSLGIGAILGYISGKVGYEA